ncbi:MAG: DinB family protein [Chloroflexi bacterium]|nr:DinB family protein [Chloroflexota bacterium]
MTTQSLLDELVEARDDFYAALDEQDPARLEHPGLVGEWSARELVAHLGYWAGRVVDVMLAVEEGRAEQAYEGQPPTDEVNATVARVARDTRLATVQKREAASVEALVERLRRIDPGMLQATLPSGATLEALVREDGPEHYRRHAEELRRPEGAGS